MKSAISKHALSAALLALTICASAQQPAKPLLLAIAPKAVPPAPAAASAPATPVSSLSPMPLAVQAASSTDTLHVLVGQSLMLHDVNPLRRIYVGNPAILQTFTSGPQEVILTAKAAGVSTMVVWDTSDHSTMYTVHADLDTSGLSQSLHAAYPLDSITATATDDHVTLSGTVATAEVSEAALKLAGMYSKEVVNSLRVVPLHGKQVQLKLTVAEVDRSKLVQFGINLSRAFGGSVGTITTGQYPSSISATQSSGSTSATATASNALNFFFYNFAHGFGLTMEDLETANLLQILAEPTLTTLSGKTARFLSGGEFPVPIVQGGTGNSTAVSVQFKQYGVKVEFLPVVNDDGTIHLVVTPEVSTLDYANAVSISGFTIPALATRRSETEIELRSGQSFMLSGLLNHTTTDVLTKVPGAGDVPIIGHAFKSKSLTKGVSELVILCTAEVVDPLHDAPATSTPKMPVPPLDNKKFDKNVDNAEKAYPTAH
ncbi:pilus assembly protein CpaC [Bryocella elongata]|uniref:Pilus assembly protein CpaC n=1 Tax=Bryocella elongata TaxID=863522 RepID=A0A1H6AXF7_9BACT|nr:type II and III secretion system protein family protein [Bryocella elongata]SEG52755.1 pilus assembly protein CpaC [Bryocella elongata]